ncbi:GlxA family transcriptional regulator [Albimonas sp. CAU 1670]|uniref:GlxA family transcriptional regulator n=1 Tax=Albimonas sp. CAU 1670 TaxID=3032599 RepID=UPI0023DB33AF|nr:GlxA family transcriptional regulator [Albimonas sp. CAU 1670]MDF2234774.1 GlxA family transcriptional regulator [Albimonas sp. CAU 1670]
MGRLSGPLRPRGPSAAHAPADGPAPGGDARGRAPAEAGAKGAPRAAPAAEGAPVPDDSGPAPERIGFLLVPQFSMMAFMSATEPLRVANRLAGRRLYEWSALSADGGAVEASSGLSVMAERPLAEARDLPMLFVCAGFDPDAHAAPSLLASLRRLARRGAVLGALDTGAWLLARAGLLDDARVTLHWEAAPAFRETFPDIEVSQDLYEIDGRRITCAGGTAAMDMMLDMIASRHGHDLAVAVARQFIQDGMRARTVRQMGRFPALRGRPDRRLTAALELMQRSLDHPLSPGEIAEAASLSVRQLERLFRERLGESPAAAHLRLRLERARELLRQTDLRVLEVATATGFGSGASFARAYRARFGVAPRADRREPDMMRG